LEVFDSMRLAENTTSSALKGVPSLNLVPGRSWKSQVVGEVIFQLVASAPSSFMCWLNSTSGS
jgi:hypothetical protein